MSDETTNKKKGSISERDKPFILALSTVILFAAEMFAGVIMTAAGHTDLAFLDKAMAATIGFMGTAFTFYLVKKEK